MVSCVFPGSFDPVTAGHMHLIKRAAAVFDKVTVAVMVNVHKTGAITVEKRVDLIRKACKSIPNVNVVSWNGLLANYLRENDEKIVIRGIRSGDEFDQETAAHYANRILNDQIETMFIPADPGFAGISSSAVREIASFGGNITPFVPEGLSEEIFDLLSNKESIKEKRGK